MRLRVTRYLKLRHIAISVVLIGAVGALASTTGVLASTGMPLGASTACGCGAAPVVKAIPNKLTFKEINVGEKEEKSVEYKNEGPGEWEPNQVYSFVITMGGGEPFDAVNTTCAGKIAVGGKCSTKFAFVPEKEKTEYQGTVEAEPGAELVALAGKSK